MPLQADLLNQAIATINGTMTSSGLIVSGTRIETGLSWAYYRYLSSHPRTLPYDSSFRVWPRTDRHGVLTSAIVITPNPSITSSTFSGEVIWKGEHLITIRISPQGQRVGPFLLTLFHGGNLTAKVRCEWFMQFTCYFSEEESRFCIDEVRSLKHLLSDSSGVQDKELVEA